MSLAYSLLGPLEVLADGQPLRWANRSSGHSSVADALASMAGGRNDAGNELD
jgi:hypothetical protein